MIAKKLTIILALALSMTLLTACNPSTYAESDRKIISAKELAGYLERDDVVVVDMQSAEDYTAGHLPGAVNIQKDDIVVSVPVENSLTSKNKLQSLLGEKGIGNDTTIIAYDSNKLNAPRFFWTLLMYGNENVLVVDGGIAAIKKAGLTLTADSPEITPVEYAAGEKQTQWLAERSDVLDQVNDPDPNVALLDVRSDEEYQEVGKVPSSIMWNYLDNYYSDGTFKNTETIRINYIQKDLRPEKEIIIYCQTSMRAAPVFLRLYDAGYRNIKIYDGAYLEWSSNPNSPIEMPSGGSVAPSTKDAS